MTKARTLRGLIQDNNIRAEATYGVDKPIPEGFKDCDPWTVTLKFHRRRMTVPFFMGKALCREPDAETVLDCLISDSCSVDNARGFGDWCAEFGYDTDSRKAERTYRECISIAKKLRRFLGEHYEAFMYAER